MPKVKGLRERLQDGESLVCAEGYLRELERRGFLSYGSNTPEVVLHYPQQVKLLHQEYVLSGSDVVEAFTYYGHRSKMKTIGREDDVERLNRTALRIAREVADATNTLMAGNICNTTTFDPKHQATAHAAAQMFEEQVRWAVEEGADYMIGETFNDFSEAKLALETIQQYGEGMPAVITLAIYWPDKTTDEMPVPEALRQLELLGADVVGLNCGRGPDTMLPLLEQAASVCQGPLAALPVNYRTTPEEKSFQSLTDPLTGKRAHPLDIDCCRCTRSDVRQFATRARALGIRYIGLCCGSSSDCIREIAAQYKQGPVLLT